VRVSSYFLSGYSLELRSNSESFNYIPLGRVYRLYQYNSGSEGGCQYYVML